MSILDPIESSIEAKLKGWERKALIAFSRLTVAMHLRYLGTEDPDRAHDYAAALAAIGEGE